VNTTPSFWRHPLLLEELTRAFIALNLLDLVITIFLLDDGKFYESNILANYFIIRWGIAGAVTYKIVILLIIVVITQIIAHHKINWARNLLTFGCAIAGAVVIYSTYIYLIFGLPQ